MVGLPKGSTGVAGADPCFAITLQTVSGRTYYPFKGSAMIISGGSLHWLQTTWPEASRRLCSKSKCPLHRYTNLVKTSARNCRTNCQKVELSYPLTGSSSDDLRQFRRAFAFFLPPAQCETRKFINARLLPAPRITNGFEIQFYNVAISRLAESFQRLHRERIGK